MEFKIENQKDNPNHEILSKENNFAEDTNLNQDNSIQYSQNINQTNQNQESILIEKFSEEQQEELEEKIAKTKNDPKNKKIKSSIYKVKEKITSLILPKLRQKMYSNSIYETVQDAGSLFKIERKIGNYLILIAGFFFLISFIEFILILTFFPLKEKEPYLVTFSNDTQNFAIIQKADQSITANEALNRQLLGAYIINREDINRIDDKERSDIIKEQSSPEVWNVFERIIAQEDSIYSNNSLTRVVKIVNIALIKKGYANADVSISLYYNGILKSEKRYRIIISYKFKNIEIDYNSLPKNPTGFTVTGYAITEIATIKELPDENKVKTSQSRIKYKNLKDNSEDDILNETYFYQENKTSQDNLNTNDNTFNTNSLKPNDSNKSPSNIDDSFKNNDYKDTLNNLQNKNLYNDNSQDNLSIEDKKRKIKQQINQLQMILNQNKKNIPQEQVDELQREILNLKIQEQILNNKDFNNQDNRHENNKFHDDNNAKESQNFEGETTNSTTPNRIKNNKSDIEKSKSIHTPSKNLPSPFSSNSIEIIKKG
ncbi:VirB8/TrbF family protein [Helicobacter sp. 11S03491-1]|uniref:VirB8/TrbF family protein n=1 Tax=Helicobacter sp. 11S03491-1 TaxID=1476196 RepID=UPI000BA4ED48|nr:VirB8/TrbF family protein [Helicobacter sp. 11S03491-1]PAF42181.1 hypothetical protein BKH45_04335 [Helicobacter sp. 11S03491-1]